MSIMAPLEVVLVEPIMKQDLQKYRDALVSLRPNGLHTFHYMAFFILAIPLNYRIFSFVKLSQYAYDAKTLPYICEKLNPLHLLVYLVKYCCRTPLDTAFIDSISSIYLSSTMTSVHCIIVVALAISTNCCELYISENGDLFEMTESTSTYVTVTDFEFKPILSHF
ncbi:hypothetical protein OUZ56_003438 [Daphnia magna]|uniref:Uncharacterized protein n=1 Tax=Daphnia magna TaxID=35525 RepID=A0ABR0A8Y6_9CRUS|nr:hypothetical protein OUZ56_003438 [Daphnia magna]